MGGDQPIGAQVLARGRVEVDEPVLFQLHHGDRREELRDRPDPEHGVLGDRGERPDVGQPPPGEELQGTVPDHSHRQPHRGMASQDTVEPRTELFVVDPEPIALDRSIDAGRRHGSLTSHAVRAGPSGTSTISREGGHHESSGPRHAGPSPKRARAQSPGAGSPLETPASSREKSLIRRTDDRLWMYETIRGFAEERFDASGDAEEVRRDHAVLPAAGPRRHRIFGRNRSSGSTVSNPSTTTFARPSTTSSRWDAMISVLELCAGVLVVLVAAGAM